MGPRLEKLLMCCVVFRGFPHCRYLIITHKVLLKEFIKKKRNDIKIRTRKRRSVPFFLVAVCLSIFFLNFILIIFYDGKWIESARHLSAICVRMGESKNTQIQANGPHEKYMYKYK